MWAVGCLCHRKERLLTPLHHLKGYLALGIGDLSYAMSTVMSMVKRNDFDLDSEPLPNDTDGGLKRRIRCEMAKIQQNVDQLCFRVRHDFSASGTLSQEQFKQIRIQIGNEFGLLGRYWTAVIWVWIQQMTLRGYGQLLEGEMLDFGALPPFADMPM